MPTGTHSETIQIAGMVMTRTANMTADNSNAYGDASAPIALTAAKAITDWVKTDADTAAGNLPAGHAWGDGAHTVDVFWTGGCRYGVTGTVSTNAVAFEGGTGDDFTTSADATVVCAIQQQVNCSIDGDAAKLVGVSTDCRAHIDFQDASGATVRALELQEDEPDCWDSDMASNPYTGNPITKALVTNGTTTAGTLKIGVLQDSTP